MTCRSALRKKYFINKFILKLLIMSNLDVFREKTPHSRVSRKETLRTAWMTHRAPKLKATSCMVLLSAQQQMISGNNWYLIQSRTTFFDYDHLLMSWTEKDKPVTFTSWICVAVVLGPRCWAFVNILGHSCLRHPVDWQNGWWRALQICCCHTLQHNIV